jgi:hypothetical protein
VNHSTTDTMTKPLYTKIQGSELTVEQWRDVQKALAPKFGYKYPSEVAASLFYFDLQGAFIGVFQ